ncbi:hypothetical protein OIV83_000773 [Microbotryomycetes sp. JL201]|nr:hypothetical protein OIV83_000773 [Microbotryomycetes sp. JL201]
MLYSLLCSSLNPSHLPHASPGEPGSTSRLHGQAVHDTVTALHPRAQAQHAREEDCVDHLQKEGTSDVEADATATGSGARQGDGRSWKGAWARRQAQKQREREENAKDVRELGKIPVPPIPDLRFEQGVLMSIRPFLHRAEIASAVDEAASPPSERHAEKVEAGEKGALVSQALTVEGAEQGLVVGAKSDIFSGPLRIEWPQVVYVIVRDQFVYPLLQGLLWGVGGLWLNSLWAWNRHRIASQSAGDVTARSSGGAGSSLLSRLGLSFR